MDGCSKKYYYLCNLKKHKKEHEEESALLDFKDPFFHVTLGKCSITLAHTPCKCDRLFKVIIKGNAENQEISKIEDELDEAIKEGHQGIALILEDREIESTTEF